MEAAEVLCVQEVFLPEGVAKRLGHQLGHWGDACLNYQLVQSSKYSMYQKLVVGSLPLCLVVILFVVKIG